MAYAKMEHRITFHILNVYFDKTQPHQFKYRGLPLKNPNPKNSRKKSPIHENADANITCDFGDGDISRLGVAYLTHVINTVARLY